MPDNPFADLVPQQTQTPLSRFRQRYSQYNDLSDAQVADGLYRKHDSDMPREEFDAKIGLKSPARPPLSDDDLMQRYAPDLRPPPRRGLSDDELMAAARPPPKPEYAPAPESNEPQAPIAGMKPGERPMVPTHPAEEPGYGERVWQAFKEPLEQGARTTQDWVDKYGPDHPPAKFATLFGARALNTAVQSGPAAVLNALSAGLGLPPSALGDVLPGLVGVEGAPHERAPSPAKQILDNIAQGRRADAPRPETAPRATSAGQPAAPEPRPASSGRRAAPRASRLRCAS